MTCQGDPPPLSSVRVSQVDSMHGSPDQLAPRARHLLRTLIARYIQDGEPVGSQTLARVAGLEVSPATIRNILGDLEDLGLLASPHTSAGRVPTAHGYRVFVDSLLQMQPPGEGELARLRQELAGGGSTQALLGSASELLSAMSHFVGVVSAPRREQFAFRQIDFVALDGRRVLAILVFADNEVQNRVIETRQEFAPGQLEQVANYLNAHFAGLPMAEIRTRLLLDFLRTCVTRDRLMAADLLCTFTSRRVLRAEELLESTDLSVDHIAGEVGFGTGAMLRHHFARARSVSPQRYRRTFGSPAPGQRSPMGVAR